MNVAVGDRIEAGEAAAILEWMKMELRICSTSDGLVTTVHCPVSETVERDAIVVVVDPG